MPYRRLPNTDVARLKALKIAFIKGKENPPFKLAFTQPTLQRLLSFLPRFEKAIVEYKQAYSIQIKKNNDYQEDLRRAKLYISHFIQVMNMAIQRGDLPESIKKFYGLDPNNKRTPRLSTEKDILTWGEKLIQGEQERTMKGQALITNPTIALVRVRYEKFVESFHYQKTLQKNVQRILNNLSEIRSEGDDIISCIWNEVEEHYKDLADDQKRNHARIYGVVYVYRKNELKSVSSRERSVI
jgi:tetratricopeptide (TPR) repeat protein